MTAPKPSSSRRGPGPLPPEKRCTHVTRRGTPCRAARRPGHPFCVFHDREWIQERDAALRTQKRLRNRHDLSTAEGIHNLLRLTVEEVRRNAIPTSVGNTVGYLTQLMMANLPRLRHERKGHDEEKTPLVDLEARFYEILTDYLLDKQEEELRRLGKNAYPIAAAKNAVEWLRRELKVAPPAASSTAPADSPPEPPQASAPPDSPAPTPGGAS
jgi:hypothetical protein